MLGFKLLAMNVEALPASAELRLHGQQIGLHRELIAR